MLEEEREKGAKSISENGRRGSPIRALILLLALVAYSASYMAVWRLHREPAANLLYFVYSESRSVDWLVYYFYWPAYEVAWMFTGQKHLRDQKFPDTSDLGP
jgi:hypothetical protein